MSVVQYITTLDPPSIHFHAIAICMHGEEVIKSMQIQLMYMYIRTLASADRPLYWLSVGVHMYMYVHNRVTVHITIPLKGDDSPKVNS